MRGWWWRVAAGAVVVAAAAGLWIWSGRGAAPRQLEVPLLTVSPADIISIAVRRLEGESRLELTPAGWQLSGVAADHVDSTRVRPLLRSLAAATAGPEIPGADPDDTRFGFADDNAVELLLTLRDGPAVRFGMGARNPVTGHVYARGAGRAGVFVVAGPLLDLWTTVPDAVRLRSLLPPFPRAAVDTLRIFARDAAEPLLIARTENRWWLRLSAGSLGSRVARYQELYGDRRRTDAAGTWILAADRVLNSLIYEVSETGLTEFAPPGTGPAFGETVGLDPPYRAVELVLAGGERHRIELGELQDEDRVWARRGTSIVVTKQAALRTAELPFADFADLGAFSFSFARVDSYSLDGLLTGVADPDSAGRWLAHDPDGKPLTVAPAAARNLLADMAVAFDRLPALEILPPTASDPQQSVERYTVTAWLPGGRRHDLALGRLPDGRPAVWDRADGKVLVVTEEILISMRAVRLTVARR